jgi:hypothetical protein
MKAKSLHLISLFLLMLVTGVFWGTWFTLTRSLDDFPAPEFIHIGKVIIANVAVPMRILMPLCILCMLGVVWFYPDKRSAGFYFSIAAFVLIVAVLLITLMVLVPIDNQIKTWLPESIPANWQSIRLRWQSFHALRTFLSVASFGSLGLAVLVGGR